MRAKISRHYVKWGLRPSAVLLASLFDQLQVSTLYFVAFVSLIAYLGFHSVALRVSILNPSGFDAQGSIGPSIIVRHSCCAWDGHDLVEVFAHSVRAHSVWQYSSSHCFYKCILSESFHLGTHTRFYYLTIQELKSRDHLC